MPSENAVICRLRRGKVHSTEHLRDKQVNRNIRMLIR
jgi:hypothetical protein